MSRKKKSAPRLFPAIFEKDGIADLQAAISYFEISLAYKKARLNYKEKGDALDACLIGEIAQPSSVDRGIARSLPHVELALAIMRLELQRAEHE